MTHPFPHSHIHDMLVWCLCLQRVNTVRDFHWYDVVTKEQVLARLAVDGNIASIATAASQFLMRSYLPQGVRGVEQYRCVGAFD
jgi:hypothetical protein